jgi:hypothetical protein
VKPFDLLPLAVPGLAYLWRRGFVDRTPINVLVAAVACAITVAPFLAVHIAIHHSISSQYAEAVRDIGFELGSLFDRAYGVLIDARASYEETETVFSTVPWLYFLAPLALAGALMRPWSAGLAASAAVMSIISYLAFNDFSPWNLFHYTVVHYIVWTLPVLTALGVYGAAILHQSGRPLLIGVLALSIPALVILFPMRAVRVGPTSVTIDRSAAEGTTYKIVFASRQVVDAVDFVGAGYGNLLGAIQTRFRVLVDGQSVPLYRGYRLLPFNGKMRLLFSTHFVAHEIEVELKEPITSMPAAENVVPLAFRFVFSLSATP